MAAVTVQDVAGFVGADPADPALPGLLATAEALVEEFLGAGGGRCPDVVRAHAVVQLTSELFARRNSPSGVLNWGAEGSVPVRLARDAMTSVEPLLRKYRPIGACG